MAIPMSGVVLGQTRFSVQAGTGADLSADFLVAPLVDGPPFVGGSYTPAQAVLTVTPGAPKIALSITATNAGVSLRFPPASGFRHTAQYRDQIVGGTTWQSLPGAPHNSAAVFDLSSASQRFYRVLVTPVS